MSDTKKLTISKSRYMDGLQCPKRLYLTIHGKDLATPTTPEQQAIFDQGHEVGARAQKEFPTGVLIEAPYYDQDQAVRETETAIKNGAKVIFEATFAKDDTLAKIDILHRENTDSAWHIIEVKSTTSLKDEHVDDVAVQLALAKSTGLNVATATLMHLNNQSTAPELKDLFIKNEITKQAEAKKEEVAQNLTRLKKVIAAPEAPTTKIGRHCHEPHPCPFVAHCWKEIQSPSIFDFPGIATKVWSYYEKGIVSLNDPKFGPFDDDKEHRLNAIRTNQRWVNHAGIKEELHEWQWPLYHLDFETINPALPTYPGTRPYEQIPFQFSLMIQKVPCGPVEHIEYLHDTNTDPRPALIELLAKALEGEGSIVAYNKGFESSKMKALAKAFPKLGASLVDACERLVDPLPIFRKHVYDPKFGDSFSIKSVAPAILGEAASYKTLEVPDGTATQRAFKELVRPDTTPERKAQLKKAMLEYCKKDTQVMVELVDWLVKYQPTESLTEAAKKKISR